MKHSYLLSILLLVLTLSGCATKQDLTGLGCPETGYVREASEITVFSTPDKIESRAVLRGLEGGCSFEGKTVEVNIETLIYAEIDPKAERKEAEIYNFFVTIMDPDSKLIGKKVFSTTINFNEETRSGLVKEKLTQRIPLNNLTESNKYKIMLGFQLDKEQLRYNRERHEL